jgi:hypothetical protein
MRFGFLQTIVVRNFSALQTSSNLRYASRVLSFRGFVRCIRIPCL